jgi:hypothetical protein
MENKPTVINTRKLFIFNLHHFIKYVFGGQVLPMIAIFAATFVFMPFSTLAFGFIYIVVMMMVYKLAFDVLADTASGNMSPMVRENYLVTNAVAIKVAVIAVLIEVVLIWLKYKGYSGQTQFYFLAFSAFLTPAIYMSLALSNSLKVAFNPIKLYFMIKTMHISYLLFVVFWLATILFHERIINPFIFHHLPVFINGIVSSFIEFSLLILNFHIMGYILFQNRAALDLKSIGIDAVDDDEIVIDAVETNPIHDNIKRLLADDEVERALSVIIELQKDGDNSLDLKELAKKAMDMKLYSPSNLDVAEKIHRRLRDGFDSKALSLVMSHLDAGKEYVETSPEDVKSLVEYAIVANKPKYIPMLIKGFHEKYPYHADIVPNYFLLAKTLYNDKTTRDKSKELLNHIIEKYPQDACISEVKSWYKGVKMMARD